MYESYCSFIKNPKSNTVRSGVVDILTQSHHTSELRESPFHFVFQLRCQLNQESFDKTFWTPPGMSGHLYAITGRRQVPWSRRVGSGEFEERNVPKRLE